MRCTGRILNGSFRKHLLFAYHVIDMVLGAKTSNEQKMSFLWGIYSKLEEDINNVLAGDMYYKEKQRKGYYFR